ncbi:MAG: DUF2189 domain-containing protein [Rhodobacteraceae bacterium]|nr:DUF2189 domain-containing protein [Paracoccaceae bacterium]
MPVVRTIGYGDLGGALAMGWRDFRTAPVFGLVIAGLFVLGGIIIFLQLTVWESSWLILPVAVGFPLIGPFVVVGLYEVSHQLEEGRRPDWNGVLNRIFRQKDRQIPSIAFIVTFFFGIWFYMAHLVFALFFGLSAMTNISTSYQLLLTPNGLMMLLAGSAVGGALAFLLFSISVVSFPLLMDRELDFVTGMITSVSAVVQNFAVMIVWAAIVAALTVLAMLPMFLGLLIVLPVLGHATWHLYRRVLEPA